MSSSIRQAGLLYTPNTNYSGPDSFTYRASDGSLNSNVATVSLTVNPVTQPPTAADESYHVGENGQLIIGTSPRTAVITVPQTFNSLVYDANNGLVYGDTNHNHPVDQSANRRQLGAARPGERDPGPDGDLDKWPIHLRGGEWRRERAAVQHGEPNNRHDFFAARGTGGGNDVGDSWSPPVGVDQHALSRSQPAGRRHGCLSERGSAARSRGAGGGDRRPRPVVCRSEWRRRLWLYQHGFQFWLRVHGDRQQWNPHACHDRPPVLGSSGNHVGGGRTGIQQRGAGGEPDHGSVDRLLVGRCQLRARRSQQQAVFDRQQRVDANDLLLCIEYHRADQFVQRADRRRRQRTCYVSGQTGWRFSAATDKPSWCSPT